MNATTWRVRAVELGHLRLDAGAFFGVVPAPVWRRLIAADEDNRIELAARALLLESGERRVVVDAGCGAHWPERLRARFAIDTTRPLARALEEAGIDPDTITDAVPTHLHFDHAGGLFEERPGGGVQLSLPRARVHVQRRHLDWALSPSPRDRASFRAEHVELLAHSDRLVVHHGPGELFDGVTVELSWGHTPALQVVRVRAPWGVVVYPADLMPTHWHVHPAWTMGFDLHPLTLVRERQRLARGAAARREAIAWVHDPGATAHFIEQRDGRFVAAEPAPVPVLGA